MSMSRKDIEETGALPKCECFQDDDTMVIAFAKANIIAQNVGAMFGSAAETLNMCRDSAPLILELAMINMLTIAATANTIIEQGTDEALWETERVLEGFEARVLKRVRAMYAMAKADGMTAEKMQAMHDQMGETRQ